VKLSYLSLKNSEVLTSKLSELLYDFLVLLVCLLELLQVLSCFFRFFLYLSLGVSVSLGIIFELINLLLESVKFGDKALDLAFFLFLELFKVVLWVVFRLLG